MKSIIVTGANSGLGLWISKYLLDMGYRVVMACRSKARAEKAIAGFPEFSHRINYIIREIDLGDFDSINRFTEGLAEADEVYGLVCNAGIMYNGPFRYSRMGMEETFAVNHLGHFLLTNLLLERFNLARIVIVASELHDPANKSPFARARFRPVSELAYPSSNKKMSLKKQTQGFYTTSKLCNILFGYELCRRLKRRDPESRVLVNSMNPGFMPGTNLGRSHKPLEGISRLVLKILAASAGFGDKPEVSAKAVADLIRQDTLSGKYFDKFTEKPSSPDSYNEDYARELWEGSEMLTGRKFPG